MSVKTVALFSFPSIVTELKNASRIENPFKINPHPLCRLQICVLIKFCFIYLVETLKSERQTTYPKAGLILRTSSFKSTNGEGEPDSRESSPGKEF